LKTALEAFYFGHDQPEAFLLPRPQFKNNHPTRSSAARFSGFFFPVSVIFFDGQLFRLFSFSGNNTYSDAKISIIS